MVPESVSQHPSRLSSLIPSDPPNVTTRVILVTSPVVRVAFGPDGRMAMTSKSWVKEYDVRLGETRTVLGGNVEGRHVEYAPGTGTLNVFATAERPPAPPEVTDDEARARLAVVGFPFAAIQRDTVRRGKEGLSYVAWTRSETAILTGTVLSGPVLITPSALLLLAEENTRTRVLMDGDDIYTIKRHREPNEGVEVACPLGACRFSIPHEVDLSAWTSIVRTPHHALLSGPFGYITKLSAPTHINKLRWKIDGEPHRVPGGAVAEVRKDKNRAFLWLHENGAHTLPATSPLTSLVRTGARELTGWHMRGQTELVVRTYTLPRD